MRTHERRSMTAILVSALLGFAAAAPGYAQTGDLNGDCCVDLADLGILLADFGCPSPQNPAPCVGDLNGDGATDLGDLGILLSNFGSGGCSGAEIGVEECNASSAFCGEGMVRVDYRLRNSGNALGRATVRVQVGPNFVDTPVEVGACSIVTGFTMVPTPPCTGPGGCNVSEIHPVTVTSLLVDPNPSNNRCSTTATLVWRYWDLQFSVGSTNGTSFPCPGLINWEVAVTNLGNSRSDSIGFRTGVDLFSGDCCWGNTWPGGQIGPVMTGQLDPGATRTFNFSSNIPQCCPIAGRQFLKVGIAPGWFDLCTAGRNYHEQSVWICQ